MPGFPVLHYLPEFAQTHVHWINYAIESSHPLLLSSAFAFNLSQHLGVFQWLFTSGGQSIVASASGSVLSVNIWGWFPLGLTGLVSLLSKGLSRVFSSTAILKHQFFGAQPSLWSNSHPYMTTGKTVALIIGTFVGKVISLLFNTLCFSSVLKTEVFLLSQLFF